MGKNDVLRKRMIAKEGATSNDKDLKSSVFYKSKAVINCGALIWLLTPDGATRLKVLIENIG
jgi:hypothetical protein